ncbi:MAG: hypothetical protein J6K95_05705 [Rikenellaceae bacterium]|nr:hypothetical protein [Rikenellaceae bacterium]
MTFHSEPDLSFYPKRSDAGSPASAPAERKKRKISSPEFRPSRPEPGGRKSGEIALFCRKRHPTRGFLLVQIAAILLLIAVAARPLPHRTYSVFPFREAIENKSNT